MKLLVTGGTGFIGSYFIKRFPSHDYTVLVRDEGRAQRRLPSTVKCITSLEQLENLDGFDGVINLAGEPIIDKRWTKTQKDIICESRWRLTEQLVSLFDRSARPPAVFLSGSAIGVYGSHGEHFIDETTDVHAVDFPSTVCVMWEEIAARVACDIRLVNLRTGIVLAKEQGALAKMLLPFKLCLGGPIGSGHQYMSWIHIDDMTAAMEFLLNEGSISGPVNLVSPEPVTNREFTKELANKLRRIAVFRVPSRVLKSLMGESASLLLDSQRLRPTKLTSNGFEFQYPTLSQALSQLLS